MKGLYIKHDAVKPEVREFGEPSDLLRLLGGITRSVAATSSTRFVTNDRPAAGCNRLATAIGRLCGLTVEFTGDVAIHGDCNSDLDGALLQDLGRIQLVVTVPVAPPADLAVQLAKLKAAITELNRGPHLYSPDRKICSLCRGVTEALGEPFGCDRVRANMCELAG